MIAVEVAVSAVAESATGDATDVLSYEVVRASDPTETYHLTVDRLAELGSPMFAVDYAAGGSESRIVTTSVIDARGQHTVDTRGVNDAPSVLIGLRLILEDVLEVAAGDELLEPIAVSLAETIDDALGFPARVAI